MKLDVPLRPMFAYPLDTLLAALPDADDAVWTRFPLRQKRYEAHAATRSIVLCWRAEAEGEDRKVMTFDYAPAALRDAMTRCGDAIRQALGGRKILQLMLAELPAGGRILRHIDVASVLTQVHRCHLPVVTNDHVSFTVDDIDFHPIPGEVFEFDNTRPHAVANNGATRRVHLICDVLPLQ